MNLFSIHRLRVRHVRLCFAFKFTDTFFSGSFCFVFFPVCYLKWQMYYVFFVCNSCLANKSRKYNLQIKTCNLHFLIENYVVLCTPRLGKYANACKPTFHSCNFENCSTRTKRNSKKKNYWKSGSWMFNNEIIQRLIYDHQQISLHHNLLPSPLEDITGPTRTLNFVFNLSIVRHPRLFPLHFTLRTNGLFTPFLFFHLSLSLVYFVLFCSLSSVYVLFSI